jgi:hypothetical protein
LTGRQTSYGLARLVAPRRWYEQHELLRQLGLPNELG